MRASPPPLGPGHLLRYKSKARLFWDFVTRAREAPEHSRIERPSPSRSKRMVRAFWSERLDGIEASPALKYDSIEKNTTVDKGKSDEAFLELGLLLIVTGLWVGVFVASLLVVYAKASVISSSWLLILVSAGAVSVLLAVMSVLVLRLKRIVSSW